MTRTFLNMSKLRYLTLALAAAVAACETPASPVAQPGDAQFAVANNVWATSITIDPATLSPGQPGQIVAHLWTEGHPLGGKLMELYIDGTLVDAKRGSRLGTVSLSVPGVAAGQHTVRIVFDGDKNFFGSEQTTTITVN